MPRPRRRRSPPPPHAQIHLPPLSAHEASVLIAMLERVIDAVWRAHGHAIADHRALVGIDTEQTPDAVYEGNPDASDDIPF